MRSFEQRIAEIDRRSKKIFAQRKQRGKHILMACIPLVVLLCTFALPAMMQAGSTASDGNGSPAEGKSGVVRIEISGMGISKVYEEPSDILLISDRLHACAVQDPESCGGTDESRKEESTPDTGVVSGGVGDPADSGYTITLVMNGGGTAEYCLTGNTLVNRTTDQTYTLSQKQANELKDLLGIPRR